jgi:hypothetical protein
MKTIIRTLLVLAWCLVRINALFAVSPDSADFQRYKFDMIKEAAIFYSSDTNLTRGKQVQDCARDTSMVQLTEHTRSLEGVEKKLAEFNRETITNLQSLERFREKIVEAVSGKGKEARKQLPAYPRFVKQLDGILAEAKGEVTITQPAPVTDVPENTMPDPAVVDTAPQANTNQQEPSFDLLNYVAIGLSVVSLLFGCFLYTRLGKKRRSSVDNYRNTVSPGDGNGSLFYETLHGELQQLKDRVHETETRLRLQQMAGDTVKNEQYSSRDISYTPPTQTVNIVKYAKTADGNAFAADTLSDRQDNKKIYELTVEGPDKGTFRVTTNTEAQLFALEDPNNYLRGACNYYSRPSHNSRIITTSPGRMELSGNKWRITKPAEIDFSS